MNHIELDTHPKIEAVRHQIEIHLQRLFRHCGQKFRRRITTAALAIFDRIVEDGSLILKSPEGRVTLVFILRRILVEIAAELTGIRWEVEPGKTPLKSHPNYFDYAKLNEEETLLSFLLADKLIHELRQADPQLAQVIGMKFFLGMRHREIGLELQMSVSQVKTRLKNAETKLKSLALPSSQLSELV